MENLAKKFVPPSVVSLAPDDFTQQDFGFKLEPVRVSRTTTGLDRSEITVNLGKVDPNAPRNYVQGNAKNLSNYFSTPTPTPEQFDRWFEDRAIFLDYPEVYSSYGDEMNTVKRDWDSAPFRVAAVSAMGYRAATGNLALPVIYSEIAELGPQEWFIDRGHFWDSRRDFEEFKKAGMHPVGLQTHRSLKEYDALLFSCSYLQTAIHVPILLNGARIPHRRTDRLNMPRRPLVMTGGHHMYVNPEPIHHVPDCMWVGEFSAGALDFLKIYEDARHQEEFVMEDFLLGLVRGGMNGLYLPWAYKEEYADVEPYQIIRKRPQYEGVPARLRKAYVVDLDAGKHVPDAPLVSFINPGMGTAEVMTSEGCDDSSCTFCSEGQTSKPYRFHSVELIVDKAKKQLRYTGQSSITLSAFDGAGHPQKRHLVRRLLEEVSDDVHLLSLRVDETAEDPLFAALSTLAGNKTLSLGVEGMSERMRHVYNKHCSEEQIVQVCERAMRAGATKLKFFMIVSHPWETEEDRLEWIGVLKRIEKIKEKLGSKCVLLTSWTPLVIMPHTALQWTKPNIDARTLDGVIKAIKEETNSDFRIGSGGRRDEAYMAQLFQIADRRIDVVVDWCVENDFLHYGSTPKGMKEIIDGLLAAIPGYPTPIGFHTWFRDRPYNEILAWDHMDVGSDREYLIWGNEVTKIGKQEITQCSQGCTVCGACTTIDRIKMQSGFALPDDDFKLSDVQVKRERGRSQLARLKLFIDRRHRFIGTEYWISGLVRAFRMADLPVDKSRVTLGTSPVKFYNYAFGAEYADVMLYDAINLKLLDRLHETLPSGMTLQDSALLSPNTPAQRNVIDTIHYVVDLRRNFSADESNFKVSRFLGSDEYIASIRTKSFKGSRCVDTDIRPWVTDMWVQDSGIVHMLASPKANPFEIFPGIYGSARRRFAQMDVVRLDFYPSIDEGQDSFLYPVCPVTGRTVGPNLLGKVDESGLYVSARYQRLALDSIRTGKIEVQIPEDSFDTDADFSSEAEEAEALYQEQMEEEFAIL